MLDAVIESIIEKGYYQTSSNEIARHAGVTWGTIQHQFGTRDSCCSRSSTGGGTISSTPSPLQRSTASPSRSGCTPCSGARPPLRPHVSPRAPPDRARPHPRPQRVGGREAISPPARRQLEKAWHPLFEQALGDAATDPELVTYAFLMLRGFLSANVIATAISGKNTGEAAGGPARARRRVRHPERAAEQGLAVD